MTGVDTSASVGGVHPLDCFPFQNYMTYKIIIKKIINGN
jgi:hypothetical protein